MPDYNPPFLANSQENLNTDSYFLYEHRRWYKEKTTEIFNSFNPNYIDLWYEVPYYGKVDTKGKIVIPNLNKMSYPLNNKVDSIGFDFTLKAINEYKYFLQRSVVSGKTNLQKLLNNFNIKSSFVSAEELLTEENGKSIFGFNTLLKENIYGFTIRKEITDFRSYVCEMVKFFSEIQQDFTLFKYFVSSKTTLKSTGLCFEFSLEDHNDDLKKNKYFKNPEFEKYVQAAGNFGFRVNKNAPWMLIADIASKPMLTGRTVKRGYSKRQGKMREIHVDGYIQENFIPNLEVFFEEYYESAMERSFYFFTSCILVAYEEYRKTMKYLVKPGDITIEIKKNAKYFSGSSVLRGRQKIKNIISLSKTPISISFLFEQYEKLLKNEFRVQSNKAYHRFYKKFQKSLYTNSYEDSLSVLEDFYSPVKLYDPKEKQLIWNIPKNSLTTQESYANLQSKDQPTVGKIVTEFLPDI